MSLLNPMEEFLKIKWPNYSELTDTEFLPNEDIPHSYVDCLLNDDLDKPYSSSEEDSKPDSKPVKQEKQKKSQFWHCNANVLKEIRTFPKSNLKLNEHLLYLEMLQKNSNFEENQKLFQDLTSRVLEEQKRFQKFAQQRNGNKKFTIKPDIKEYIDSAWKHRFQRVKEYPPLYNPVKMIPLIYGEGKPPVEIEMIKYIEHMGRVPYIVYPTDLKKQKTITSTGKKAENKFPSECDKFINKNLLYKTPVSMDKNASIFASQHNIDIVISSSALKCLSTTSKDPNQEWDIPFSVKSIYLPFEYKSKKVIFIDKPLPPRSMSAFKQMQWYNKKAVKATLCDKNHDKSKNFPAPIHTCLKDFTSNYSSHQDDGKNDNENELCDCDDRLISPSKYDNVVYSHWKISSHKNELIKQHNEGVSEINVLIRTRADGHRDNNYMSIRTKVEPQPAMGCEMLTPLEITKLWTTLFFKPKTQLLHVRVDLENFELLAIDSYQLKDLNVNSQPIIGSFYTVFDELLSLAEGQYLLSHKEGSFCQILESSLKGDNLFEYYTNGPTRTNFPDTGILPWFPIDPVIFTNYHKYTNGIPAMFPPALQQNKKIYQDKKREKYDNSK